VFIVGGGTWTCSGSGRFRAAGNMVELLWAFLCIFWFREIDEGEMVFSLMTVYSFNNMVNNLNGIEFQCLSIL